MPRKPKPAQAARSNDRHNMVAKLLRLPVAYWEFLEARRQTTGVGVNAQIRDMVRDAYRSAQGDR